MCYMSKTMLISSFISHNEIMTYLTCPTEMTTKVGKVKMGGTKKNVEVKKNMNRKNYRPAYYLVAS